ncbi:MAG: hypothetical protein J6X55_17960 [Victivallales bacterium]|nr:hypothetical protein [Victivallales bacterium]
MTESIHHCQRKNLAVGHFYNEPFIEACKPWVQRIAEVFFAWPGVLSCRPAPEFTDDVRERLFSDLRWCRENGIRLDTLFNCNCYGEQAISTELANFVVSVIDEMDDKGLSPDIVTTTSPFIATIIRRHFPHIRIRASVNLRAHGTLGMEAVQELFDEYYISREYQRSFPYVENAAKWAKMHGKQLGMQVNSGCLRDCPFQIFHDNLHGHNRPRIAEQAKALDFSFFRCRTHYERDNVREDILKATWIRPEDVPLWEPYVSLFKIATRRINQPTKILNAYASYNYDGNLLDLLDPVHADIFAPDIIDNKSFPSNWATSGIGNECAMNCTHCGKCATILAQVMHTPK